MKLNAWYKKRGLRFILERAQRLVQRYGLSSQNFIAQLERCMDVLRKYDCFPTFAVPGMVVQRNSSLIKQLQEAGAEIAVHGYNHVDMQAYPPEESSRQLHTAAEVFRTNGLDVLGFRCPYLSASDDILKALPQGDFEYSSNKAIQWPVFPSTDLRESLLFETLQGFYAPGKAQSSLCLPWFQEELVEIPICVPDDLQLHDGYGYGVEQISQIWVHILHQIHQRGEVFTLMFHPELASFCETPFITILQEARSLRPGVWLAQLRDVSAWWKEKSNFWVETECVDHHFDLKFHCTPRATILCRGFDPNAPANRWDKDYWRLESQFLNIDTHILPFIGLPPGTKQWIIADLRRMGYILDTGVTAPQCSLYLDEACLRRFDNPVDLIAYIELTSEPLIRFWPWPDGMRSTLCITGDLDALSLFDYAFRLLKK